MTSSWVGTRSGSPRCSPTSPAVVTGQRVLDVGCGPGALTSELVRRLGPAAVAAVDPSESFVAAAQARQPDVSVRRAVAEQLPFADDEFDAALAQLVVHFMADPVAGLREMARVTRPGGVVAACVWDHGGGHGPLSLFWSAARQLRPGLDDESTMAGAREGHLAAAVRRRRPARGRGGRVVGQRRAADLRRLVGAVHARCRPRGRSRRRPRALGPRRAPRAVPPHGPRRTLRRGRPVLGGARRRLTLLASLRRSRAAATAGPWRCEAAPRG